MLDELAGGVAGGGEKKRRNNMANGRWRRGRGEYLAQGEFFVQVHSPIDANNNYSDNTLRNSAQNDLTWETMPNVSNRCLAYPWR